MSLHYRVKHKLSKITKITVIHVQILFSETIFNLFFKLKKESLILDTLHVFVNKKETTLNALQ